VANLPFFVVGQTSQGVTNIVKKDRHSSLMKSLAMKSHNKDDLF